MQSIMAQPRSLDFHSITKVQGRRGKATLSASVPARIVRLMRLQPGDSIEYVWTNDNHHFYCKVVRIPALHDSDLV